MNTKLVHLFQEYAASHQHPMNRLTHKIAIPLIVFHIFAMLNWIPLIRFGEFTVTAGHIAYLGAVLWYLSLDARLAVPMALCFALVFPIAEVTPPSAVIAIALGGWTVQLAGHLIWEKKRPAFMDNIWQTLVGPLFFVAILLRRWPNRRPC